MPVEEREVISLGERGGPYANCSHQKRPPLEAIEPKAAAYQKIPGTEGRESGHSGNLPKRGLLESPCDLLHSSIKAGNRVGKKKGKALIRTRSKIKLKSQKTRVSFLLL